MASKYPLEELGHPDDDFEITVVPRESGMPPFRFNGRLLSRHRLNVGSETTLEIGLWQTRQGKFVLSYTALDGEDLVHRSSQLASLGDAIDNLEDYCRSLTTKSSKRSVDVEQNAEAIIAFLEMASRITAYNSQFPRLAGEAMAIWDEWEQDQKDYDQYKTGSTQ